MALDHSHLDVVIAGEQKRFPLFVRAFFDCEPVFEVLCPNQLREFIERREHFILRQDASAICQYFSPD